MSAFSLYSAQTKVVVRESCNLIIVQDNSDTCIESKEYSVSCKTDQKIQSVTSSGMAKLVLGMESRQEQELAIALENPKFRVAMLRFYK